MSNLLKKCTNFIIKKDYRFYKLANWGYYTTLSDEEYLRRMYKSVFGRELNLVNPETFNEKLQWLKLYDRNAIYTTLADKYEVKNYVSNIVGEEHIVPTIGVWNNFSEIDFSILPQQFVLKCTHDSGGLVICTNKNNFDIKRAEKKINACLKRNFYLKGREWPYKDIKPRIMAEKYMVDDKYGELRDYKFFCFNGIPRLMFIASDRQKNNEEVKFDFYDMNFNHLDITNGHPMSSVELIKPNSFEIMKKLSGELSVGIPQVRVDFYEVDNQVYFGEMTFFHHSGFCSFTPDTWDKKMGDWIELPRNTK